MSLWLVIRGVHRYTRNPMYVGLLPTPFGWARRRARVTGLAGPAGQLVGA
jgi:protein-S-isoprenylcysteine O-methyltransferase Ste14